MYPTLPFGPLSLPTGPIVLIVAVMLGLEMAGRYGRRLGLSADDVWNCGLLGLLGGLIAARLWNVIEFWPVYVDEPGLILSIRPSGFVLLPGAIVALIVGYLYLLRKALNPLKMAAACAVGALAGGSVMSAGAYLTGNLVGTLSAAPWALPYFGELRHPVAFYQAVGLWLLFVWLWLGKRQRPGETVLLAGLGYSLLRLFTDAFVERATLIGGWRTSQIIALATALILSLLLARSATPTATSNK